MLPGRQLAAAGGCENLAISVNDFAATDRDDGPAGDFPAREDREPGVRQLVFIANRSLQIGIPDDDIRIGAKGDRPLPRINPNSLAGLVDDTATICSSVM